LLEQDFVALLLLNACGTAGSRNELSHFLELLPGSLFLWQFHLLLFSPGFLDEVLLHLYQVFKHFTLSFLRSHGRLLSGVHDELVVKTLVTAQRLNGLGHVLLVVLHAECWDLAWLVVQDVVRASLVAEVSCVSKR